MACLFLAKATCKGLWHPSTTVDQFPKKFKRNRRSETFVNLIDLMPTFLEVAGVALPKNLDGMSLVPVLKGKKKQHREEVFLERERHCMCRKNELGYPGYPMRAIRTKEYLYILNLRPQRMPAGDPTIPGTPSEYGDVDGGPTKAYMMDHAMEDNVRTFFKLDLTNVRERNCTTSGPTPSTSTTWPNIPNTSD